MTLRRRTFSFLRWVVLPLLALAALLAVTVQAQQWLLRWRAQRLMADMHQIRLYQTTWADAQRLMHKWGRWGRYEGTCTAQDCRYRISIGNSPFRESFDEPGVLARAWFRLLASGWLGGRLCGLDTELVVHNGTIWRTKATVFVDVPPRPLRDYYGEYGLLVSARAVQALPLEGVDQMEEHPYYYVTRPGGCENCFAAHVFYSTHAPSELIAKLTDFNFECFTRLKPCEWLGDLQPLAWQWRLYSDFEPGHTWRMDLPPVPLPCAATWWALGRDSQTAMVVDALSNGVIHDEWYGAREKDQVRIVSVLKGKIPFPRNMQIGVIPFNEDRQKFDYQPSEHLEPGKRYVLLFKSRFNEYGPRSPKPIDPLIQLDRCGVQPDSPELRRELAKGMAMNDSFVDPRGW